MSYGPPHFGRGITMKADVMGGKPCIDGTRITVETVVRRLSDGYSLSDILTDYPALTEDDLRDVFDYTAHMLAVAGVFAGAAKNLDASPSASIPF